MSGVLAVFDRSGAGVDPDVCNQMIRARPEYGPDGETVWTDGPIALGFQSFIVTEQDSLCAQPRTLLQGAVAIVADARLDNREQLAAALGLAQSDLARLADADLILRAYLTWDHACLERLLGDFVFVIWDRARQELFVGRDALGARSACFHLDARWCILASSATQVLAHPATPQTINDGKVAEFLVGFYVDQRETFYADVSYCLPAHGMVVGAGGWSEWRYWSVDHHETLHYQRDEEYVDEYRRLLTEAVRCRLRTQHTVSISLSGGLDSTVLAAVAASELGASATQPGGRLKSYSYAFDRFASCDERDAIRPVVQRLNLDAVYVNCDELWTLSDPATWPVDPEYVLSDPYARLPLAVAQAANAAGSRLLLGGYFGDTLFIGSRYWVASLLRDRQWRTVASQMWARAGAPDWGQMFVRNGLNAMIPASLKKPVRQWRRRTQAEAPPCLHPDLIVRAAYADRAACEQNSMQAWPGDLRSRYRGLFVNLFVQGAAAVRHYYNGYGIEPEQPYFDRRLVEFSLCIPAYQLGMPDSNRPLARAAFRDKLSGSIVDHRAHAVFLPLLEEGLLHRERAFVEQLMKNSLVIEQKYVSAPWLQTELETLSRGLGDHNQHGHLIWKVICLELWLRHVTH